MGEPLLPLLSLVVVGKALPYLHNGIMVIDCDDEFAVIGGIAKSCSPLTAPNFKSVRRHHHQRLSNSVMNRN
jgi:hypothetical protein